MWIWHGGSEHGAFPRRFVAVRGRLRDKGPFSPDVTA